MPLACLAPAAFFLFGFHVPLWAEWASFAFLAASFYLDARITVSNKKFIQYESNALFRFLLVRLRPGEAVLFQAASEVLLLFISGLVLSPASWHASLAAAAQVFGLGHFFAWIGNRRFVASAASQVG